MEKKLFRIYIGLGGGFGGYRYSETDWFLGEDDAWDYAYEQAFENYLSYVGLHGLRDIDQIVEEEGVDKDEAYGIMREDAESWLSYDISEVFEGEPLKDESMEYVDGERY